jgi:putative phosphoribosyl transferase
MSARKLFRDRVDAGQQLASRLARYRDQSPVVLGLPRGGVTVAYEVAETLDAPFDVCIVRKIGAPMQHELAIGAIAEEGVLYLDGDLIARLGISEAEVSRLMMLERVEVDDRVRRFRRGAAPIDIYGKTVLVVDDGIATGATARAALQTLRARGPERLVLAVPVGAPDTLDELATIADEVVCLHPEEALFAVGLWYEDFAATTDDDVVTLLDRASSRHLSPERTTRRSERVRVSVDQEVQIRIGDRALEGRLTIPGGASGLVVFAHGSGSGRSSPRNQSVAAVLHDERLATLLFDLLTPEEQRIDARTQQYRFDIELLASRLVAVTEWAHGDPQTRSLDIGYFGASTGAAAALVAAATRPQLVRAVVCRGGRPDLAEASLGEVDAPTLLLVGGADPLVLQLNREAMYFLRCEKEIEIVHGATHLFEEPGALEQVARSAARWFTRYLGERALESTA